MVIAVLVRGECVETGQLDRFTWIARDDGNYPERCLTAQRGQAPQQYGKDGNEVDSTQSDLGEKGPCDSLAAETLLY